MSRSAGYTLDQLLRWCKQDRLIDGFRKVDGAILIWSNGTERSLSYDDARLYLTQMFTAVHRNPADDASDSGNIA